MKIIRNKNVTVDEPEMNFNYAWKIINQDIFKKKIYFQLIHNTYNLQFGSVSSSCISTRLLWKIFMIWLVDNRDKNLFLYQVLIFKNYAICINFCYKSLFLRVIDFFFIVGIETVLIKKHNEHY